MGRVWLWLSAAFVVGSTFFPNYIGSLVGRSVISSAHGKTETIVLGIAGMTCSGCEASVEHALSTLPGIVSVSASYADARAVVEVDNGSPPSRSSLVAAVARAGYVLSPMAEASEVAQSPSVAGHWMADLVFEDADTVRMVLDLGQLESRWVGEYDVAEFEAENYPVEVSLADSVVGLHFAGSNADFAGQLSKDGKILSGILHFGQENLPAEFRRTGGAQFSESLLHLEAAAHDSSSVAELSVDGTELRNQFNADQNKTRFLMLLSPT